MGMYIENQDDLAIIFDNGSQYVTAFLEDCYLETEFCTDVKNADWQAGENLFVFGKNSSIIREKEANIEITGGKPGSGKGSGR